MGEHSDYNGGFVLPCAIDAYAYIALAPSHNDEFTAVSLNYPGPSSSWLVCQDLNHDGKATWSDHLRGLTEEFIKAGHSLKPMNLAIASDVPIGCGLSSSAALQISFAQAMNELNALNLSPLILAQYSKQAENNFVGSQCGIMDQLVSATAKEGHASLIDCENLTWKHIPLDPRWQIAVINSGIQRTLTGSSFNTRVEECEQVRSIVSESLRKLSSARLESYKSALGETLYRRARHVSTDNHRVPLLAKALQDFDEGAVSELMTASHVSMDQDFEMTIPQINDIFHLIREELGPKGGIRLTGGGWGGALVVLTTTIKVQKLRDLILNQYNLEKQQKAEFFCFKAAAGASYLDKIER